MMPEVTTSPKPPAYTGDVKQDIKNISGWVRDWYRVRVANQRIAARLDAAKALDPLTQTISNPPTQTEVQAVQDKINQLIQALQ